MTNEQAMLVAASIMQNEGRTVNELTDSQICGYLIDAGYADTDENVNKVKAA